MTIKEIHAMKYINSKSTYMGAVFVALALFTTPSSFAGPGHDHGDEALTATGEASPRVVMESDLFEAVGILKGRTLEIYIDHTATNAPVENAELDLELNGSPIPVELHAVGEFDAVLPEGLSEGSVSVALTVSSGELTDLLAGQLDLSHADDHATDEESHSHAWEWVLYGLGGMLLLGLPVVGFVRKKMKEGKQS